MRSIGCGDRGEGQGKLEVWGAKYDIIFPYFLDI